MTTTFLKLTPLVVGQTGKETTVNSNDQRIENATQRTFVVDMSGGNVVLTEDQFTTNFVFNCDLQTADRDLTVPDEIDGNGPNSSERVFAVNNLDGEFTITVKQDAAGKTVVVLPGESTTIYADGTDIVRLDNTFDIGGFFGGVPAANALMMRFVANRPFTIPVDMAGTANDLGTAADAETIYLVKKNGSNVGTITVAIAGTVGVLVMASATVFAIGDILTIVAPASPDATAADFSFTIAGQKG